MIETFNLKNGVLEFEDETHTYRFNGKECISVTQLLKKKFPKKYDGIDSEILKKASEHGSYVHLCIELFETLGLETNELKEFRNYNFLKSYYRFNVLGNELPIVIQVEDIVIAGRMDMILEDKEFGVCLCDIKSTSILDLEYLVWQLNLYKLGYEQTYGDYEIKGLKALHLKNDTRKYVHIATLPQEEIINFIKENNKQ